MTNITKSELRKKIEYVIVTSLMVGAVIALLAFAFAASIYQYRDCKKVGHTTTYCILDVSK